MNTTNHYVSAIKWKRGERMALTELEKEQLSNITPLIEIQPMAYNHSEQTFHKNIDEHLKKFSEEILSFWPSKSDRPLFLDIFTLFDDNRISNNLKMKDGKTPLEFILEESYNKEIFVIPIIPLPMSPIHLDILKVLFDNQDKGIALRIDINYFKSNEDIAIAIKGFLNLSHFEPTNVDLILDYKELDIANRNNYVDEISSLISFLPYLKKWKTFTLLSTSMPENLSHLKSGTISKIPRIEWKIYQKLIKSEIERIPIYGDYNVNNPAWFDFNPQKMQVGANIKYTSHNDFLIFRGYGVRNNGFEQYHTLALDTINHKEYQGKDFSYGDMYIYNCATDDKTGPGNAETWARVSINHHIAFVLNQLASLPSNAIV